MYNVSKLSTSSSDFLKSIPSFTCISKELVPMALARAISSYLPLPSGEVKMPTDFYTETVLAQVRESVSMFSDLFAFDTTRALELTRMLWLVRYKAAFPSNEIFGTFNLETENEFLGYGSVLAAPEVTFIKENAQKLIRLFNCFSKMIREMGGFTDAVIEENNEVVIGGK